MAVNDLYGNTCCPHETDDEDIWVDGTSSHKRPINYDYGAALVRLGRKNAVSEEIIRLQLYLAGYNDTQIETVLKWR